MSREEAIKELQESLDTLREYDIAHSSRLKQALEMAIQALENHDTFMKYAYSQGKQDALSQKPCDDAVSRARIIDELNRLGRNAFKDDTDYDNFFAFVDSLSSVNPQPWEDAISRSGAIKAIEKRAKRIKNEDTLNGLAGAVGILFELPPVNPQYTGNEFFNFDAPMVKRSMEQDAVSRDAVLGETIRKNSIWNSITNSEGKNLEEIIFELPPVNPQSSEHFIDGVHAVGYREGYKDAQKQKSGKWLITPMSNIAYCSECDYLFKDIPASVVEHFNYCPNCGCRMVATQESEE